MGFLIKLLIVFGIIIIALSVITWVLFHDDDDDDEGYGGDSNGSESFPFYLYNNTFYE